MTSHRPLSPPALALLLAGGRPRGRLALGLRLICRTESRRGEGINTSCSMVQPGWPSQHMLTSSEGSTSVRSRAAHSPGACTTARQHASYTAASSSERQTAAMQGCTISSPTAPVRSSWGETPNSSRQLRQAVAGRFFKFHHSSAIINIHSSPTAPVRSRDSSTLPAPWLPFTASCAKGDRKHA